MNQTPVGTRAGMELEEREDDERGERGERDAAERRPHVTRRDVPPPAVVEAGQPEHGELDPDDDEDDLPVEVVVVVDRPSLVEPQHPGEHPGRRDDRRVGGDLPQQRVG